MDGLRQFMWSVYRIEVVEVDTLVDGHDCDLLRDEVFADLLARIRAGEFFTAIIGTPCGTFSVARIPKSGVYDGGPRQLRDINRPGLGRKGLSLADQRALDLSNILEERSVLIAVAIRAAGGSFVIVMHPAHARLPPAVGLPNSIGLIDPIFRGAGGVD